MSAPLRVYLQEWLIVYTSAAQGEAARKECGDVYNRMYDKRVRSDHAKLIPASQEEPDRWEWQLQLFLWNLRGEFTSALDAAELASLLGDKTVTVRRYSTEEDDLLAYGKRRLRDDSRI